MKLELQLEESDYMLEMFTAITVANLKWDLVAWESLKYVHPNDAKVHKQRIKAAKLLIKYYSGVEDEIMD